MSIVKLSDENPNAPLRSPRQEKFCQLYTGAGEFFGNGYAAYVEAYNIDVLNPASNKAAYSSASMLLTKPMVLQRINFLLENQIGFNDAHVDKQLSILITQGADLRVKLGAIREYNALKGRVKKKLEISLDDKSEAELDQELDLLEREIAQAEALKAAREQEKTQKPGMPVLTEDQKMAMNSQNFI